MLHLKKIGLTLYDTVIQRSGSTFSLLHLILMSVIAGKDSSQKYTDPNGRHALLVVLIKL